jgi:hypothetical protein
MRLMPLMRLSMVNYNRLIDNALLALERCKSSGSEWGINYWTGVVNALLKQAKANAKLH